MNQTRLYLVHPSKALRESLMQEARLPWEAALGGWLKWLVAAGRPASTVKLRTYQLGRFARDNPEPWDQSPDSLIDWLAGQSWSIETRRSYRAALRCFYSWAHATGRISLDPARLLPPIRPQKRAPRPTSEAVLAEALEQADERTRLIILLASRQGLRRGEIALIHSQDVVEDLSGWSLLVHGKGDKERLIPLHEGIARELRGRPPGWIFPGQIDGHLSPRWVGDLVQRYVPTGCHSLRHHFATRLYDECRDLLVVQELLGHSKPETTQQYVKLPTDAMRDAMRHAA